MLQAGPPLTLAQVADGAEGLVLADLARAIAARPDAPAISLAVICRDGQRMAALSRALAFFGPDIRDLEFPAWDCLPYDRVSPNAGVVAQRMTALSRLARVKGRDKPSVLLTTVNAALQRVPAREFVATPRAVGRARQRHRHGGHRRTGWSSTASPAPRPCASRATTRCAAAFSISIRPAWTCRCGFDFFGDALETIRTFDAQTQRSETRLRGLDLVPVAEFQLVTETIRRFRTGYVAEFGAASPDDLLYEAVSEGRRYPGMEHWLPLFHDTLETLFDYLPGTPLALEPLAEDAAHERFTQIADYYDARREALKDGVTPAYKPLPPGAALSDRDGMEGAARQRGAGEVDAVRGAGSARRYRCRRARRPQFRSRTRRARANVFEA